MKNDEMLILDSNEFTMKNGNKGHSFQCVYFNRYGRLSCSSIFVNDEDVIKSYAGPGVYKYHLAWGDSLSSITKVADYKLP